MESCADTVDGVTVESVVVWSLWTATVIRPGEDSTILHLKLVKIGKIGSLINYTVVLGGLLFDM